jgi:hypothetical protein
MQAYGVAVFFHPSDVRYLDPPPQTLIGTDIPIPISTGNQTPTSGTTPSSLRASNSLSANTGAPSPIHTESPASRSASTIAGLAAGVSVVFILVIGAIFAFLLRKRKRRQEVRNVQHFDPAISPMGEESVYGKETAELFSSTPAIEIGSSGQIFLAELGTSTHVATR